MANSASSAPPDIAPADLVYIEKVRQATRRLGSREVAPLDVREALQALRDVAHFDAEVPTASSRREVELLKSGVKRMSAWYMRYLASQLNAFGASLVRMGDALVSRTEALERGADDFAARLGAAEERLRRLEDERGTPPAAGTAQGRAGSGSRPRRSTQARRSR